MIIKVPKKTQPAPDEQSLAFALPELEAPPQLFLEPDGEPDIENGARLWGWFSVIFGNASPDLQSNAIECTVEAMPGLYDPETQTWDRGAWVHFARTTLMKLAAQPETWPCGIRPTVRTVPIMVRDMDAYLNSATGKSNPVSTQIDSLYVDAATNYLAERSPADAPEED